MSKPQADSNISDESIVIKQYKTLIDKLIPLQQENRLLEGLNKFSSKIPSRVRNIIKEEVIRLTSLTDASADNSEFASFPVMKFKHFGVQMRLDKVGQDILKRETDKYLNRYTVGVFESVMNSSQYQNKVKAEQQEKIVNAFSVESQTFTDIDFGDDLAVRPNFAVFCPEFDKGRNCPLSSCHHQGMTVETKRMPIIETEDTVMEFTFPAITGLTVKAIQIKFERGTSSFNKVLSVFETDFTFAAGTPKKLIQQWHAYIEKMVNHFPLQRDLEIERVMQDLERDRVFSNSPWVPVFVASDRKGVSPAFQLMTATNHEYNNSFSAKHDLPCAEIFQVLFAELSEHKETFLLKGVFETARGDIHVAATHRQLAANKMLKQFIEQAGKSKRLKVIQCRLNSIKAEHKHSAFDIHDLIANEYPELGAISHILFCQDVSEWVGNLVINKPEAFRPFSKAIIDKNKPWSINMVMESESDRRAEVRYVMEQDAVIKTGLFSIIKAVLQDLSASGLKLKVIEPENVSLEDIIKISIKELKVAGQKYKVIAFNKDSGILRLQLPSELRISHGQKLKSLFSQNAKYFNQRDISLRQKNTHRFLWELCIRNLPCASVLATNNRFSIDRLKTVYLDKDSYDLKPFDQTLNEVPLHGFFADKEATRPSSVLLDEMFKHGLRDTHVVHALRVKDDRIIFIKEDEFMHGKTRGQIQNRIINGSVEAFVTKVSAIKCSKETTPLTAKRLAQLSKFDTETYDKIIAMQKGYTHVLYLTNVSCFHEILLRNDIAPKHPQAVD